MCESRRSAGRCRGRGFGRSGSLAREPGRPDPPPPRSGRGRRRGARRRPSRCRAGWSCRWRSGGPAAPDPSRRSVVSMASSIGFGASAATCSPTPQRLPWRPARRWPSACGRGRWTSSRARPRWSAREAGCDGRSPRDAVPSMIFFGPPGSGKTTLARIIARATSAHFEELSAVQTGVSEVRRVHRGARPSGWAPTGSGRSSSWTRSTASTRRSRTPCCRRSSTGLITLIGATTENPYFEVNSALLSRCAALPSSIRWTPRTCGPDRRAGHADARASSWRRSLRTAIVERVRRRRAQRAERPGGARPAAGRPAARSPREQVHDAARSTRCATTATATSTTTSSPPSSRACAAPTPTPPSTGWR